MNSGNRLKSWTMIQSLDPSCFCFSQCRLNTGDITKCKYANFTSDSVGFSFRLLCSLPKIRSTFKNCKHGKGNTLFKYFEGKNLKKKKRDLDAQWMKNSALFDWLKIWKFVETQLDNSLHLRFSWVGPLLQKLLTLERLKCLYCEPEAFSHLELSLHFRERL